MFELIPSEKCIEMIKKFEGFESSPYKCPAGVFTIGYGFTRINGQPITENTPQITREQADEELKKQVFALSTKLNNLLTKAKIRISKNNMWTGGKLDKFDKDYGVIKQNEYDAIVSLVYNIGLSAFSNSTMLKLMSSSAIKEEVSKEFLKWVYVAGKRNNGLSNRRLEEKKIFDL